MANRTFTQFSYGFEKFPVTLYATVDFNASSAPVLKSWTIPGSGAAGSYATAGATGYKGVKSIVRTAQGKYTVTLSDPYIRIIDFQYAFKAIDGITSPLALNIFVMTEAVASATPTIVLGATGSAGSTSLTDLGANDRVLFTFILSNSTST